MPKPAKSKSKSSTKAYCFWVLPKEGNAEEVARLLRSYADHPRSIAIAQGANEFAVCEPRWRTAGDSKIFTATAFKLRSRAFPSVVGDAGPEPLVISPEKRLGEPMCFAYDPAEGVAVVLFAANGPRHTLIAPFLAELGFEHELQIEPILRADMMERLDRTRYATSIEFNLKDVRRDDELKKAGLPVERAIEMVDSVGGVDVHVHITMGREKRSLAVDVVKGVAYFLQDLGGSYVTRLQLKASESEDQRCETLDLLNARIEIEMDVSDAQRELDRDDCQRKLVRAMKEVLPAIRKQRPS